METGSITFSTALDNAQLEKDLNALTKKIEKTERDIAKSEEERIPIVEQLKEAKDAAIDALATVERLKKELADSEKLTSITSNAAISPLEYAAELEKQARIKNGLKEQEKILRQKEHAAEQLTAKDMKIVAKREQQTRELARQKEEAGYLVQQIDEAKKASGGMSDMLDMAGKRMDRFLDRVKKLASRVFVFTMITKALRVIQQLTMKYIKTNDEARQAIAMLKGALLTLAQPLVEVIIPAFTALVNILARVIAAAASLFSALFGKTLRQSKDGAKALYKEASAIEGVGDAAREAAGSLAGFDEINTIQTENTSGGGAGSTAENIAPDFDWMDGIDGLSDRLAEIADLVGLIAAGLALWKISEMLPGVLGTIAEKLAGILLAIGGLLLLWNGLTDAWENGVDWLNLIEMIGGLAAAALGLYLLFGPIAAGIVLVAGGLALLATGFHDAMENGFSLENTLLSIAGILAAGLGISLITGSWIPLLIAGIASMLLALTVATGHGEELIEGIRSILDGFKDFFVGIFTGDMEKAVGGIVKIFDGLKTSVFAVIDGIKDSFLRFLNWLDEKTGGKFHGIIETAKGFIIAFCDGFKSSLQGAVEGIKQIFIGFIQFVSGVFTADWDLAWEGIQNIFKGAWNGVISLLEGAVNLIIKGINWLISQMNKISFDVPDWVPGVGGKSMGISIPSISEANIPRLAQGAVIPPNREFLAVLGDQTRGNNLELPEELLRQIVREESGSNGDVAALLQQILAAVRAGQIIMVDGAVFGRTAIRTINSANTAAGKQLLLI